MQTVKYQFCMRIIFIICNDTEISFFNNLASIPISIPKTLTQIEYETKSTSRLWFLVQKMVGTVLK